MERRRLLARLAATAGAATLAGCAQVRQRVRSSTDELPAGVRSPRTLSRWLDERGIRSQEMALVLYTSTAGIRAQTDEFTDSLSISRASRYPQTPIERTDEATLIEAPDAGVYLTTGTIDREAIVTAIEEDVPSPTAEVETVSVYRLGSRSAIGVGPDVRIEAMRADRPVETIRRHLERWNASPFAGPRGGSRDWPTNRDRTEAFRRAVSRVVTGLPAGHRVYLQSPGPGAFREGRRYTDAFPPAVGLSYAVHGQTTAVTLLAAFPEWTEANETRLRELADQTPLFSLPSDAQYTMNGVIGRVEGTLPTNEL